MAQEELTGLQEEQFEILIEGLLGRDYGLCDGFLDAGLVKGLRSNLMHKKVSGVMHPAGVGRKFDFQKNTLVRGDVISWIEKDTLDVYERILLDKLELFINYLNKTCYTSINDYEFHYAYYEKNSFYKRHLDQFKSNRGRKYSLVFYLNDDWKDSDGGNLTLYLQDDKQCDVYPMGGRAVFFKSDQMEHEVHPSLNRFRISIAGWLKSV